MSFLPPGLIIKLEGLQTDWRTLKIARQVASHAPPVKGKRPLIIFNASTRLSTLSQNAAFALLSGWALQLAVVPVVHFTCMAGMSRCVLGTDPEHPSQPLPCRACMHQTRINTHASQVAPFRYREDAQLKQALAGLSVPELTCFETSLAGVTLPLGALVLPSIRWRLRLSDLNDDEPTRFLLREYLLSAWNVAVEFLQWVERLNPVAALIFNGQFFPEAAARWVCRVKGIPSVTHEVGMQPLSGFFTPGEATAYPVPLPDDFQLSAAQNDRLDAYLSKRMQGQFSMAGIRFWAHMKPLDADLLQKIKGYRQVVPVFTNVIFDTSQPHSNTLFSDMFTWLDLLLDLAKSHPDTLFVLRAHPDEKRAGKLSRQSVAGWVQASGALNLPNLVFVDALEYLSSYELIEHAKFILIYNSTIGMEAAIMGKAVLAAGKSRFTPHGMVYFPASVLEYKAQVEAFLQADRVAAPESFRLNARRFLYYLLYRACLPFDEFLQASRVPGVVRLRKFNWQTVRDSGSLQALTAGLLENQPFLYEQE